MMTENCQHRTRKAAYAMAERVKANLVLPKRVREWLRRHPRHPSDLKSPRMPAWVRKAIGRATVRALRAERRRPKRHHFTIKSGVLYVHRKGSRKRIALPVVIHQRKIRKGRGLDVLPQVQGVEAMLLRHWRTSRGGKPPFNTLSYDQIADLLPVPMDGDAVKHTCQRLGLYKPR